MELEAQVVALRTKVRQAQEEAARREARRDEAVARRDAAVAKLRELGVETPEQALEEADRLDAGAAELIREFETKLAESHRREHR